MEWSANIDLVVLGGRALERLLIVLIAGIAIWRSIRLIDRVLDRSNARESHVEVKDAKFTPNQLTTTIGELKIPIAAVPLAAGVALLGIGLGPVSVSHTPMSAETVVDPSRISCTASTGVAKLRSEYRSVDGTIPAGVPSTELLQRLRTMGCIARLSFDLSQSIPHELSPYVAYGDNLRSISKTSRETAIEIAAIAFQDREAAIKVKNNFETGDLSRLSDCVGTSSVCDNVKRMAPYFGR